MILPNPLPDLTTSIPTYGLVVNFPFFSDAIQASANYGSGDGVSLYLAEVDYRYYLPTPFFSPFLIGGVHYLYYNFADRNHNYAGANLGLGLKFGMGQYLDLQLAMKVFVQEERMVSFSGGLLFRL